MKERKAKQCTREPCSTAAGKERAREREREPSEEITNQWEEMIYDRCVFELPLTDRRTTMARGST